MQSVLDLPEIKLQDKHHHLQSIFLISFPATINIEDIPSTLINPLASKPIQRGKHTNPMDFFTSRRRLLKTKRPRCGSTDTPGSSISLPISLSTFISSSSTSSRARRVVDKMKDPLGRVIKRRKLQKSAKGLKLKHSRRPSTLDFRCIGCEDDEFVGLVRKGSVRLGRLVNKSTDPNGE